MEGRDIEFEYFVNSFTSQLVGRYGLDRVLAAVEESMCCTAVDKTITNAEAANMLKMNRTRLQNMLKTYGIRKKDMRPKENTVL